MRRRLTAAALAAMLIGLLAAPAARAGEATADEALSTLKEQWPAVAGRDVQIAGPTAATPVTRYLGDNIARLASGDGAGRLLVSSRPLRAEGPDGDLRPVDLTLADAGAVREPIAAPFELQIDDDAGGGFTIGPDPERAIGVRPVLDGDEASRPRTVDGKVFFANTREDTDTLLQPVAAGVETFDQLRSEQAPEAFAYRLELSPRHRAWLEDGRLTVTYDGVEVVRVLPPIALDADDRTVPASLRLDGDTLTIDIPHRGTGVAYPVMLDPTWESSYDYRSGAPTGNEGLYFDQTAGGPWYELFAFENGSAGGLWARPVGGRIYPEDVAGKIFYEAPGTTRIASAHWRSVSHLNDAHRQTMRLALYGGVAPQVFDHFDVGPGFSDEDILQDDPTDTARGAQMWLFTPPCTVGENDCPRFIPTNSDTFANVGALDLELIDDDLPNTSAAGTLRDLANTWSPASGHRSLTFGASDGGAGVLAYRLDATDAGGDHPVHHVVTPCDGEHNTPNQGSNLCPAAHSTPIGFDTGQLPEGQTTFRVTAEDLAGNDAAATSWRVFVDRTAPGIDATGQLRDTGAWTRQRGDLGVRLRATDGRSGVSSYELWAFDDEGRQLLHDTTAACASPGAIEAPCPSAHASTLTIDGDALPEGEVTFRARSTDHAGNRSPDLEWTVRIDRRAPVARVSGELSRLEGDWTGEAGDLDVDVSARDVGSGVARIELHAVNADGRSVLASSDVCDADPCPPSVGATLTVDGGDLPDGRTSFEVIAYDLAGNESDDGADWDTYFDHTAPATPRNVTVRPKELGSVEIGWDRPTDTGSGIAGYQYQVVVEGQPFTQWQTTTVPRAKLGGLPPGVSVRVLVRALDKAANVSPPGRGDGRARASAIGPLKKAACIAARLVAEGVDFATGTSYATMIVDAICDTISKGIREVEKRLKPIVEKMCKAAGNVCEKVIKGVCKVVNKIDKRVCDILKEIACFASDLDTFCSKKQKDKKAADRKLAQRRAELRQERIIKTPGGSMRMFGRDALNRATGARADVSPKTIRHRRANRNEGRATADDVPGVKPGCWERGHLIARMMGGIGSDPRNFVALDVGFNRGYMQRIESRIIDAVEEGRTIKIDVRPVYSGKNPYPTYIDVHVRTLKAKKGLKDFSLDDRMAVPRKPGCR